MLKAQLLLLVGTLGWSGLAWADERQSPPDRIDLNATPAGPPLLSTRSLIANGSAMELGAGLSLARSGPLQVVVACGGLRDLDLSAGAFVEATVTYDVDRLRLAALAHLQHLTLSNRDPIDVAAVMSASVRIAAPIRLGVSYVVQDLEEALDDEGGDGGARQYVGPDITIVIDHRAQLDAGAAFGLASGPVAPGTVGRVGLSFFY